LIEASLQHQLQPNDFSGTIPHQLDPVSGQHPQPADLRRPPARSQLITDLADQVRKIAQGATPAWAVERRSQLPADLVAEIQVWRDRCPRSRAFAAHIDLGSQRGFSHA
jgi:hypothetical protein